MKRLTVLVVVLLIVVTACDTGADHIPTEQPPGFWTGPSDWPGPLRVEPAGGAATVAMEGELTDPTGDIGEGAPGWLDITSFGAQYGWNTCCVVIDFSLADDLPVPIQGTAAYGLVADVDSDGTADVRFGIANTSDTEHVQWLTDLATGHTDHTDQLDVQDRDLIAITFFPSQHDRPVAGVIHLEMLRQYAEFRFYLWASQIVNSGVVAIDFAPDEGWIDRPIGP